MPEDKLCDFPTETLMGDSVYCVDGKREWHIEHRGHKMASCPHPVACQSQGHCLHPKES